MRHCNRNCLCWRDFLASAARQLANDRGVLDWVARDMPKEQASILIAQPKDMTAQHGLVSAPSPMFWQRQAVTQPRLCPQALPSPAAP